MVVGQIHDFLSRKGRDFSVDLLSRADTKERIKGCLERSNRWKQRKSPLQPMLMVWLILCLPLFRARSIPNVLAYLLAALRAAGSILPLKPVTDGALSHARKRIGVQPLKSLFQETARSKTYAPTFHGLRVSSIDGSMLTVPDTPANERKFGRPGTGQGKAAWPQMRAVTIVDVRSHRIRAANLGRCKGKGEGERSLAVPLLDELGVGDLILMDRGFYSAPQLSRLLERKVDFISRMILQAKPKILQCIGPGDYVVKIKGRRLKSPEDTCQSRRRALGKTVSFTFTARMIVYRVKGAREPVCLVTSLLDSQSIPAVDIIHCYHDRWESETSYDEIKVHMASVKHGSQHTIFRSKNPDFVEQEFWAMLCVYNLVRELMQEVATAHGFSPLELSFVDFVHALEYLIPEVQSAKDFQLPYLYRRVIWDLAQCRLRRTRRHRAYERVVKVKLSKYGSKKPGHGQRIRNIDEELCLV